MIAQQEIDTQSGRETLPPVWFFIWRLLPYRPPLRLARSAVELLCLLWPLSNMLLRKAFYDALHGSPTVGLTVGGFVILLVVQGTVGIAANLLRAAAGTSLGFWVNGLLRRNLLARILARPGSRALPGSVGEAISTLRDDVEGLEYVDGLPLDLLTDLVYWGGGLALLLWVDVQVTLLVFVPIVGVIALAQVGKRRLEHARVASRDAAARFSGGLGEVLTAVQAVQVAGAEDRVVAHLSRLAHARQRAALLDWLQQQTWGALFGFANTFGTGLVLFAAAAKMRRGAFTVGDLALFCVALEEVSARLIHHGSMWVSYRLARVSLVRLLALLRGSGPPVPPEQLVDRRHPVYRLASLPAPGLPVLAPADRLRTLEVDRLSYRHAASGAGIEDISFALERGTLTAIVGRIGSGKTTLLRALLGLLPAESGAVRWNGARVDDLAAFCAPPRVAYTPQVPVLLSDTLRENVLLGVPDEPERLARAVRRAVLERDIAAFPDGLDTLIGVRGMRLSGGQAQRTAAARMFVREPELLVLDDISSALDVETEQLLWQRMFDEGARHTCLVVSHRRAVLERADQILVMEQGRLTASGTLVELLETSEELRRLYGV
ncbi:MAG: ABC transporter ATP-binding protein [Anaerolineae bacterium]|nr:ABC transporter ATP-binding protein [Anaerolineae bacterium]